MPDVEILGPASWNSIIHLDALPEPRPHTVFARAAIDTLGGTSAGKALHLTELGRSTRLTTLAGADAAGAAVTDGLRRAGVPLEVMVTTGASERHTNLLTPQGERLSIYLSLPEPAPGAVEAAAARLSRALPSTRAVVADLAGWTLEVLARAGVPRELVWTDAHDYDGLAAYHQPFLVSASHVFLNADGLTRVGASSPGEIMHRLVDDGAAVVVCTLGADGARAVDHEHREWSVPAAPASQILDTNGAGDGFLAGYLHASLEGADVGGALVAGAAQAARALGSWHLSPLLDTVLPAPL